MTTPRLVLAAAVALLALAGAAVAVLRPEENEPEGVRVVETVELVRQGGALAPGFGSVWAADRDTGEVVRVDPATRKVLARIDTGGSRGLTVSADAVWAGGDDGLARIDPRTNRVVARVPLSLGVREVLDVVAGPDGLWVLSNLVMRRVDVARNALGGRRALNAGSFLAQSFAADAERIYVERNDGGLIAYDTRTGKPRSAVPMRVEGRLLTALDGLVVVDVRDGVAAVDPRTGVPRWTQRVGTRQVNGAVGAGAVLWIHGTDDLSGRDGVWRLDARTGRVTGHVMLDDFGAAGAAVVGGRLWLVTPAGRLLIVSA